MGKREEGKRRGLQRGQEGDKDEGGRQLEGGKREREEGYKGDRKEIRMKGGDSWKEGRGKEKRVIKGKGRGDG